MKYTVTSIVSLISHLHTATADFTNKRLAEKSDLVSSHGFILFQLAGEEKLTMSEIAERINRDKSTTTVLVRKLCDEGFVKKIDSKEDTRIKYIQLTKKGKEWNELTSKISHELLTQCFKKFTAKEKDELLRLLNKMNDNLDNSLK